MDVILLITFARELIFGRGAAVIYPKKSGSGPKSGNLDLFGGTGIGPYEILQYLQSIYFLIREGFSKKKCRNITEIYLLKYLIENHLFFRNMSLFLQGGWVVTLSFLSYVILGGRWVAVKGYMIDVTK